MHGARIFLAELHRARSFHDLFCDDTATVRCLKQQKSMVGIHTGSLAEPADTRVQHKFMYLALNVHAKRIP